jgi:hypothetical protein
MEDRYELAELKINHRTGCVINEYAMSTIVTNLIILPHCLLKIVSDYYDTDSPDKVLELVKSFEINKVYEVVYYSNDNYDILNHLNIKQVYPVDV